MPDFSSPPVKDLTSFKKLIETIPEKYKSSFAGASRVALEKVCDPNGLHVWETDSDLDDLLQLTFVIGKLLHLGESKQEKKKGKDRAMIIIAEEKKGRRNFARLCRLVSYLSNTSGSKYLEGTVCVVGKILIVRGWDNSVLEGQHEALEKAVKRITMAIERGLKMHSGTKKIVWHQGAVIRFLNHWINSTTSALRNTLHAITVTGALELTSFIGPSTLGRANRVEDLMRLEKYAMCLGIPVVFLDASSQLLTLTLGAYMYYFAYYIHTFFSNGLREPHLHKGLDSTLR